MDLDLLFEYLDLCLALKVECLDLDLDLGLKCLLTTLLTYKHHFGMQVRPVIKILGQVRRLCYAYRVKVGVTGAKNFK